MLTVHWLAQFSIASRLYLRNPGKRRFRRSCTLLPQQFERLEQRIAASECLSSFAVSSLASHAIAKNLELPDNPSSANSSQVEAETDTTQESMDAVFSIGLASARNHSGATTTTVSPSTTKSPQPAIASLDSKLSSGLGAGLQEISPPSQQSFSQPTRQIVATQPVLNPVAASPGLAAGGVAVPGLF